MNNLLNYLKNLPGKVVLYCLIAVTVAFVVLQFLGKSATLKAKEMNLAAIISDAIEKLKIKQNKQKIKELDKEPKKEDLEKDPNKVLDFYKKRNDK